MRPVLERASDGNAQAIERTPAAEDFSFFLNEVPGLFFNLGIVPHDQDLATVPPNHSDRFFADEIRLRRRRAGAGHGDGELPDGAVICDSGGSRSSATSAPP